MSDQQPQRHHFQPETYLEGFKNNQDSIWLLPKGRDWQKVYSLRNIAVERNLYRIEVKKGYEGSEYDVEKKLFADSIEGPFNEKMAIVERRHPLVMTDYRSIYSATWEYLSVFIASMHLRTPHQKRSSNRLYEKITKLYLQAIPKSKVEQYLEESGESRYSADELIDFVRDEERYSVGFDNTMWVDSLLHILPELSRIIFDLTPTFVYAPKGKFFITSDTPVAHWVDPRSRLWGGIGFTDPNIRVLMPLSSEVAILLQWDSEGDLVTATPQQVREINDTMVHFSDRFIYSPHKLARLKKATSEFLEHPYRWNFSQD